MKRTILYQTRKEELLWYHLTITLIKILLLFFVTIELLVTVYQITLDDVIWNNNMKYLTPVIYDEKFLTVQSVSRKFLIV